MQHLQVTVEETKQVPFCRRERKVLGRRKNVHHTNQNSITTIEVMVYTTATTQHLSIDVSCSHGLCKEIAFVCCVYNSSSSAIHPLR